MENTNLPNASETIPNTLTLYRQLFNHLDLSAFNPSELLDLAALLLNRRKVCATA